MGFVGDLASYRGGAVLTAVHPHQEADQMAAFFGLR
jgi:hypothetical protein